MQYGNVTNAVHSATFTRPRSAFEDAVSAICFYLCSGAAFLIQKQRYFAFKNVQFYVVASYSQLQNVLPRGISYRGKTVFDSSSSMYTLHFLTNYRYEAFGAHGCAEKCCSLVHSLDEAALRDIHMATYVAL
jgi:hypothetical protein